MSNSPAPSPSPRPPSQQRRSEKARAFAVALFTASCTIVMPSAVLGPSILAYLAGGSALTVGAVGAAMFALSLVYASYSRTCSAIERIGRARLHRPLRVAAKLAVVVQAIVTVALVFNQPLSPAPVAADPPGTSVSEPHTAEPTLAIPARTTRAMYFRSGPSDTVPALDTLRAGVDVIIVGRPPERWPWVLVEIPGSGVRGWVNSKLLVEGA